MKLVYTVLVLMALVYAERRLIEPRPTGARLNALVQAALVYMVLVYTEWHQIYHWVGHSRVEWGVVEQQEGIGL